MSDDTKIKVPRKVVDDIVTKVREGHDDLALDIYRLQHRVRYEAELRKPGITHKHDIRHPSFLAISNVIGPDNAQMVKEAARRVLSKRIARFVTMETDFAKAGGVEGVLAHVRDNIILPLHYFGISGNEAFADASTISGLGVDEVRYRYDKKALDARKWALQETQRDPKAPPDHAILAFQLVMDEYGGMENRLKGDTQRLMELTGEMAQTHEAMKEFIISRLERQGASARGIISRERVHGLGQLLIANAELGNENDPRFKTAIASIQNTPQLVKALLRQASASSLHSPQGQQEAVTLLGVLYPEERATFDPQDAGQIAVQKLRHAEKAATISRR